MTELEQFNKPFTFTQRPRPLPGDLRPIWRVAVLLMMLYYSRGKRASLQKLHVLNWAIRDAANRKQFIKYMRHDVGKEDIVTRVEPSLNRAIDLATGERLVEMHKGRMLRLTGRGIAIAKEVAETTDCLYAERDFLVEVKTFATERNISDLVSWGGD